MLELEDWYFGNIDQALASKKCKEDGEFLVRNSETKQKYIITCRWNGQCSHYTIDVSRKKIISTTKPNSMGGIELTLKTLLLK